MESDMDFAFVTAVGPLLGLTVACFFLAFVGEFAADGELLSQPVPEDEGTQQI
jgi:hypothetical protein